MSFAFNDDNSKFELNDFLLAVYPVGSIYMSVNDVNPGTLFGGTWVSWGAGRVPVSVDENDTKFNNAEQTGGAATHTLTANQIPGHTHTYAKPNSATGSTTLTSNQIPGHTHTYAKPNSATGSTTVSASSTNATEKNLPTHLQAFSDRVVTAVDQLAAATGAGVSLNGYSSTGTVNAVTGINGAHTHTIGTSSTASGSTGGGNGHTHTISTTSTASGSTGGGNAHNNLQPYITCYMWKRTA